LLASTTIENAIGARAARSLARAVEHDELLTQQQVFGDQLRFAANQIRDRADQRGHGARLAPAREGPRDGPEGTLGHGPKTIPEETEHQRGLLREWSSAFRQRR
jgi:hypothetical protein